ncbi:DUF177 domain-containing protein [Croceicoccus sp. F390]|uniref:DUF177 domain-containing protein n=1 Tax=Croceicoccus esteveae TaxID=3075597 RepID=A0ABU2ZEW1_9SPHN|nr:DUF177 domain-containing protein [Croceicoccus sp. F390]MDT0575124.1 DUF177 domain-containing protein [Croceicoccus sp. F390]
MNGQVDTSEQFDMNQQTGQSELSRMFNVRHANGSSVTIDANAQEQERLAVRFGIVAVERLSANVTIWRDGERDDNNVHAQGMLHASIVQACAVSDADLAVELAEPLNFLFVPARADLPEELELGAEDLDEIFYSGDSFDLGEAVAQSLALAIDPFLTGPEADVVRQQVGLDEPEKDSPFAVLKTLGSQGR